jgi:hypothetical protein
MKGHDFRIKPLHGCQWPLKTFFTLKNVKQGTGSPSEFGIKYRSRRPRLSCMGFRSKVPGNQPIRQKGFPLTEVLFLLAILSVLLAVSGLLYSGYKTKVSETVVQEDLRQAYTSAMAFFINFPQRALTRVDLEKYGFRASPQIETRVVDGRLVSLLLICFSSLPDSRVFMIHRLETSFTGAKDPPGQVIGTGGSDDRRSSPGLSDGIRRDSSGGPLIQPINESGWGRCNEKAKMELKEGFDAAQKYFSREPGGSITRDILSDYGCLPNEEVNRLVINGTKPSLEISTILGIPGLRIS